jgi:TPR repeat protein
MQNYKTFLITVCSLLHLSTHINTMEPVKKIHTRDVLEALKTNEFNTFAFYENLKLLKQIPLGYFADLSTDKYFLGLKYYYGLGAPLDLNKSLEYLTDSAQQGNLRALYFLGVVSLETDIQAAFNYLKSASDKG